MHMQRNTHKNGVLVTAVLLLILMASTPLFAGQDVYGLFRVLGNAFVTGTARIASLYGLVVASNGTLSTIAKVPITMGGTNATTKLDARTNLGVGENDTPLFAGLRLSDTVRTVSTETELIAANADATITQIILIKPISLTADLTITKQYDRTMGAVITTNSYNLTINTSFEGVSDTAFSGTGVLLPNTTIIKVAWFGAKASNSVGDPTVAADLADAATNTAAINAAIYAASNPVAAYFVRASRIVFEAGNYYIASGHNSGGVNCSFYLANTNLSGGYRSLSFEGANWRTTFLTVMDDTLTHVFYDNDPGGGGRTYLFSNMQICNTYTGYVSGTTWHPATVFGFQHISHSEFKNIYIYRFTEAFNPNIAGIVDGSSPWVKFDHCYVKDCKRGFTLNYAVNNAVLIDCDAYNCGYITTPLEGWGYYVYLSHGVSFIDCDAEGSYYSPAWYIVAGHGITISGGDVEVIHGSRSIILAGDANRLYDIRYWTTGVSITGVAFWNTLGIEIRDGVSGVQIAGNGFKSSYPDNGIAPGPLYSFRVNASSPKYVANISLDDSNAWNLSDIPSDWYSATWDFAVTYRGKSGRTSYATPTLAYSTWDRGKTVENIYDPLLQWTTTTGGTLGTLNGNATNVVNGTSTNTYFTVSDLTDCFPGMWVKVTHDDNSTQAVKVGSCQNATGVFTCSAYPAINGTTTSKPLRYRAPVFARTQEPVTRYIPGLSHPAWCDNTGAVMNSTLSAGGRFGQCLMNATKGASANYAVYQTYVPYDFNSTVQNVTARLYTRLAAADVNKRSYVLSLSSVASSSSSDGSFAYPVTLNIPADASGAANDLEIYPAVGSNAAVMTNWKSHMTPGQMLLIKVARAGNDTTNDNSTVASYTQGLVIGYGANPR